MLRLIPIVMSALLMAAHFLRAGELFLVLVSLLAPGLVALKRPWAPLLLRALLVLASLEWLRTLWDDVHRRLAAGEPWLRLALILGAVALLTGLSALAVRLHHGPAPGDGIDDPDSGEPPGR